MGRAQVLVQYDAGGDSVRLKNNRGGSSGEVEALAAGNPDKGGAASCHALISNQCPLRQNPRHFRHPKLASYLAAKQAPSTPLLANNVEGLPTKMLLDIRAQCGDERDRGEEQRTQRPVSALMKHSKSKGTWKGDQISAMT